MFNVDRTKSPSVNLNFISLLFLDKGGWANASNGMCDCNSRNYYY